MSMLNAGPTVAKVIREAPDDPARKIQGMPPNMGKFLVPQVSTMSGLSTSLARTYRPSDEALKHALDNARFMRNDVGIMECIEARQRSVALLDWHLEPEDAKSQAQKDLCENLTNILRRIPRFTQYRENLLHALWWGRYAVQNRYQWRNVAGAMRCFPSQWKPINGDKLVFRIDDGMHDPDQVGIRVGQTISLQDAFGNPRKIEPTERGMAYFLQPYERQLLVIHKHMIEDGEFETPENADRINGVGIRSKIYWEWFQKQELLGFLIEYLERSAFGIEIWYYPSGNPKAKEETEKAATERIGEGRNIILVGKPIGEDAASYGVERVEPGLQGCEALKDILDKYYGHRIKRYILGQTLTSEADATGLGSGLAELHLGTYLDIVKYDATNLEETVTTDLVEPIKLWNFPEAAGVHVRFVVQTETQDAQKKLESYRTAWEMGARIKESDVMEAIGASIPTDGDHVLQNQSAGQAPQGPGGDGKTPGFFGQAGMDAKAPPDKISQGESDDDGVKGDDKDQYARGKIKSAAGQKSMNWEEEEHPRGPDGQFVETEGESTARFVDATEHRQTKDSETKSSKAFTEEEFRRVQKAHEDAQDDHPIGHPEIAKVKAVLQRVRDYNIAVRDWKPGAELPERPDIDAELAKPVEQRIEKTVASLPKPMTQEPDTTAAAVQNPPDNKPEKIRNYGYDRVEMSKHLSFEQLHKLQLQLTEDPENANPLRKTGKSVYLYTPKTHKKLDNIAWAITYKLADLKREREGQAASVSNYSRDQLVERYTREFTTQNKLANAFDNAFSTHFNLKG